MSRICNVKGKRSKWQKLSLQEKGRKGTADGRLLLGDGSHLLFELKIKPNAVSSKQLKRHLKDSGWGKRAKATPAIVLITPDFKPPLRLSKLKIDQQRAVEWVPWTMILSFMTKELRRGLHSDDRLVRDAFVAFLKSHTRLKKYILSGE